MRRYIIKSKCVTDDEKDNIKEKVLVDIQRNESVALKMNALNKETDNSLKQSSDDCMKTPAIENEYKKLDNSQPQIETLTT